MDYGDVIVVAPDGPRSAQSSAITVEKPLFINECPPIDSAKIYSTNGTPVDCIKLAMHAIIHRTPDIILSGINHGSNSGNSIIYSGTMGATMEGCMLGIPSIGFSLLDYSWEADFSVCDKIIRLIITKVLSESLPKNICLNVNIPAKNPPKGIRTVRASHGRWTEEYHKYTTPHGRPFYWLTGTYINDEPDAVDTDDYWLNKGYATIVPVRPDQSATDYIHQLEYTTDFH